MVNVTITRVAPDDSSVRIDWTVENFTPDVQLVLEYKPRDAAWESARTIAVDAAAGTYLLTGIQNGMDYELRLAALADGDHVPAESATRLVRTGPVPGIVVNYIHPDDYTYNTSGRSTASPSLVMLPDGTLLASHDVFWQGHGQNLTMVFASEDGGRTWRFRSQLHPCFWGKLFWHRGALYMLSTATEYGALLIRRSDDGGFTWSSPTEILPAGDHDSGGPHKAPVPVVEYRGRVWTAVEHGSWKLGRHDAGVVSVPADADLLDSSAWTATPFLPYDPSWPGTIRGGTKPGYLEGNVVVAPDGRLLNILRYNTHGGEPDYGRAIVLEVNTEDPAAPLTFDRVIDFEGNMSKFTIMRDPQTGTYWSLVNRVTLKDVRQRNILTLVSSSNLIDWRVEYDVLNYEENGWHEDHTKVGFQYVDGLIDGDDLLFLSRTAINGAWNYHNANHITFHRISNFRGRIGK